MNEEAAFRKMRTPEEQWNELTHLTTQQVIQHSRDGELASRYMLLLNNARNDRMYGDVVMLGMMRAPASKNRHHAFEGGLVAHLLQMWKTWGILRPSIMTQWDPHPITDSLVWRAILHHDLNKVRCYKLVSTNPWEVDYADINQDRLDGLLGPTHKTIFQLMQANIPLSPILYNALITAEGGFSRDKRPSAETAFAKLLYVLDELSANVFDRLMSGQFWDSKVGGMSGLTAETSDLS